VKPRLFATAQGQGRALQNADLRSCRQQTNVLDQHPVAIQENRPIPRWNIGFTAHDHAG
jgi:hypothetical protein